MRSFRWPRVLAGAALVALASFAASADEMSSTAAADALLAGGDPAAAATAYEAITRDETDNAPAWFGLGRARIGLQQFAPAAEALRRADQLGHAPQQTRFLLARALAGSGDTGGAIEALGRLAQTGSTARLRVLNTPEFAPLRETPEFEVALHALRPCRADEYRQFDFWLGDWDVTSQAPGGATRTSHNRITSIEGGCVILEQYDTPGGYTGTSLNYYDARTKTWNQTWIDNQGQPIVHSGGIKEGNMVLSDDPPEGKPINRTTWTPLDDGRVRQHWQNSTDGGKTWNTLFDGTYSRRR